MKPRTTTVSFLLLVFAVTVWSYPPGVGITSKSKNCLSCHVNNGPWPDDEKIIIDIIDKESNQSLKQPDGSFLFEVKRGQTKTVMTIVGRAIDEKEEAPYRNAWIYVDPKTVESSSLSKFAPGWEVNLPLACRVVGDSHVGLDGAKITVLPMTIRPADAAQNAELQLQVMLTKGESVKGKAKEGMIGNYFERRVVLRVMD